MVPTPLTSFSGPHAASQTDAMFGFNAYFVNRLNPSPHLAVTDTCAGCHYKVTTASEATAKQTSNHSFLVDTTLCASCHSANVDGVALQAANQAQLDALRGLVGFEASSRPSPPRWRPRPAATIPARAPLRPRHRRLLQQVPRAPLNVVIAATPPTAAVYARGSARRPTAPPRAPASR